MAMTRASRNVGLRTIYDPWNPPDAKPTAPYQGGRPDPYGREPVNPPGYEPGGSGPAPYDPLSSIRAPAPSQGFGYGGGSPSAIESNVPPPPAYEPGGGIMPTPTPPPRPSGLGGVLSKAVQPAVVSRAAAPAPAAAAPAGQPQSNAFTTITAPNSNPTDRNRPQMGALNLSGLLGGLFGGGGAAPQPAPPPPPARTAVAPAAGVGRGGVGSPDMTGVIFDQNGNPTWNGLDASVLSAPGLQQQDPTQLAATVGRPGWWKPLR